MTSTLKRSLLEFERVAKLFPTDKALSNYLSEHPNADRSKHRVEDADVQRIKDELKPHQKLEKGREKSEKGKAKHKEEKAKKDEDKEAEKLRESLRKHKEDFPEGSVRSRPKKSEPTKDETDEEADERRKKIKKSASRIARRFKILARDHSPDPHTYRAYLSEFKQGEETGLEQAENFVLRGEARSAEQEIEDCGTVVDQTVHDLMEVSKRMNAITSRGQVLGVNENRLAAKMSGILSTLFYFTGRQKGLARALRETAHSKTLPSREA